MAVGDYLSNAGPMDKRKICRTNVETRNTTGIKRAILYQRKRARVVPPLVVEQSAAQARRTRERFLLHFSLPFFGFILQGFGEQR